MPEEKAVWSEDVCTCEHPQSAHKDTQSGPWEGPCEACAGDRYWDKNRGPGCMRYQWNGEPRRRIW